MVISLQINGSPTELQQVLSAISSISAPDQTSQQENVQQVEEPKKTAPSKKSEPKTKVSDAPKVEETQSEKVEEAKQPEEVKQEDKAEPTPVKRIDLEQIRKEFGPRYMASEKKATVAALLKEFGHEKLGPFYEAASEEDKSAFYTRLIAI